MGIVNYDLLGSLDMLRIDFCFETITPESAEHGDFDSHGYITPGYWKYPMDESGNCDGYEPDTYERGDLGYFINFAQSLGICDDSGSGWIQSVDPDCDYATGDDTFYSMHISGCTESTKQRIHALLRS